jgi:hypothetical protein
VHEAGREVPDSVAERVRLGFLQVGAVVEAQQPAPGGKVSGDVGGEDPAAVDLPGFEGRFRRPIDFAVRTPPVSTTACSRWTTSMYCG